MSGLVGFFCAVSAGVCKFSDLAKWKANHATKIVKLGNALVRQPPTSMRFRGAAGRLIKKKDG